MSFESRYSDDQRKAIFALAKQGKNARVIAEQCNAGLDGLEPFKTTQQAVGRIIRQEREKEPPTGKSLYEAVRRLGDRAVKIVDAQLDNMESTVDEGGFVDVDVLKATLAALDTLEKFARRQLPQSEPEKTEKNGKKPEPAGLIEELLKA